MLDNTETVQSRTSLREWLRWIAVLPAALGAYIGIQLVVGLVRSLETGVDDRPDYWSQFISGIAGPYCLVLAGAKTAPRYRFVTALTLTVLHGFVNGSLVTLAIVLAWRQSASLWWLILCCAVGIIASIVACIQMRREEDTSVGHDGGMA
jgi:uncharacterized membrane protein HdeD (DUF308 family)